MPIIEFSNLNKYGNYRTRRFYHPTTSYSIKPDGLGPSVWVKLFKYTHKHVLPPNIMKLGGKTYIMPGWQEVIEGTTLDDVIHIQPKVKKKAETIVVETLSSKGDKMYKTRYYPDTGNFTCTCPGTWMSGNNCKHIKKLRNEVK